MLVVPRTHAPTLQDLDEKGVGELFTTVKAVQSESRAADHALSHAREERARCDAVLNAQRERVQEAVTRARDKPCSSA